MAFQSELSEKENTKVKEPRQYKVVMYNDDFTPMDFVVDILVSIFHKQNAEATQLMLGVHKGGKAVVGIYSYDLARTRTDLAMGRARDAGYPFRVMVEKA